MGTRLTLSKTLASRSKQLPLVFGEISELCELCVKRVGVQMNLCQKSLFGDSKFSFWSSDRLAETKAEIRAAKPSCLPQRVKLHRFLIIRDDLTGLNLIILEIRRDF